MKIYLNGELITTKSKTLSELIEGLSLQNKRFAIEHNFRIINKSTIGSILISENDSIEIIHAVGGG